MLTGCAAGALIFLSKEALCLAHTLWVQADSLAGTRSELPCTWGRACGLQQVP